MVCKSGKPLWWKLRVHTSETMGRQLFVEKVPMLVPDWSIFYECEEFKFAQSDWSK